MIDDRSGPLFWYVKGRCHGNRICAKMGQNYLPLIALSIQNGMGYRYLGRCVNSANDTCILCENFVKFGPVIVDMAHLWTSGMTWPKNGLIWSHWDSQLAAIHDGSGLYSLISPDILDGFSQSFHHMKALYVQMMDLYLIFQFVKGRFDGNQIILPL